MTAHLTPDVRFEQWNLPEDDLRRFWTAIGRALTRRCPYCGGTGIFSSYLALRERCPQCGVVFEREEGYFLGAYAFNLVFSEILGLGLAIILIFKTQVQGFELIWQEAIAIALAVAFPLLFFPYSRGVWMAFDIAFHPPRASEERQLHGSLQGMSDDPAG